VLQAGKQAAREGAVHRLQWPLERKGSAAAAEVKTVRV